MSLDTAIGLIAGAMLAGLTGGLAAYLSNRHDAHQKLIERKITAYQTALEGLYKVIVSDQGDARQQLTDLYTKARMLVLLQGSDQVKRKFDDAVQKSIVGGALAEYLIPEMRKEIEELENASIWSHLGRFFRPK